MKKRNKKYNPRKDTEMIIRHKLSHTWMVYVAGCGGVRAFDSKGNPVSISGQFARLLEVTRQQWSITMYACLRDVQGNDYLQSTGYDFKTPVLHDEIRTEIADIHWQFIKTKTNANDRVTAAWVASVGGREPSDELAFKMFEQFPDFDELISKREYENSNKDEVTTR